MRLDEKLHPTMLHASHIKPSLNFTLIKRVMMGFDDWGLVFFLGQTGFYPALKENFDKDED